MAAGSFLEPLIPLSVPSAYLYVTQEDLAQLTHLHELAVISSLQENLHLHGSHLAPSVSSLHPSSELALVVIQAVLAQYLGARRAS